jgi:hypothetical protein
MLVHTGRALHGCAWEQIVACGLDVGTALMHGLQLLKPEALTAAQAVCVWPAPLRPAPNRAVLKLTKFLQLWQSEGEANRYSPAWPQSQRNVCTPSTEGEARSRAESITECNLRSGERNAFSYHGRRSAFLKIGCKKKGYVNAAKHWATSERCRARS